MVHSSVFELYFWLIRLVEYWILKGGNSKDENIEKKKEIAGGLFRIFHRLKLSFMKKRPLKSCKNRSKVGKTRRKETWKMFLEELCIRIFKWHPHLLSICKLNCSNSFFSHLTALNAVIGFKKFIAKKQCILYNKTWAWFTFLNNEVSSLTKNSFRKFTR